MKHGVDSVKNQDHSPCPLCRGHLVQKLLSRTQTYTYRTSCSTGSGW